MSVRPNTLARRSPYTKAAWLFGCIALAAGGSTLSTGIIYDREGDERVLEVQYDSAAIDEELRLDYDYVYRLHLDDESNSFTVLVADEGENSQECTGAYAPETTYTAKVVGAISCQAFDVPSPSEFIGGDSVSSKQ